MMYREACIQDIPKMQVMRHTVKENTLSDPALVTDQDCEEFITKRGKGWICEINSEIVGFAIADLKEQNIWALFVHPDFEKKGIGKHLHTLMMNWYFQYHEHVWLGTAPQTRAEEFYKSQGWIPTGKHNEVEVKFELTAQKWKNRNPTQPMKTNIKRPDTLEYKPHFQKYIDLVGEGNFLDQLEKNKLETIRFFKSIPEEKHNYRYAEKKWTVKEVLMHIIDTERGFSFRTLVCARGDNQMPLHSLDENLYAANVDVTNRTMDSLLYEFETVRNGVRFLFENLTEEQSKFLGNNITHCISARALGYIIIGHVKHHNNVVKQRY